MIGNGGHARQLIAEFEGEINVVAIGDNRTRKRVVEENPDRAWGGPYRPVEQHGVQTGGGGFDSGSEVFVRLAICAGNSEIGVGTVVMSGALIGHNVTVGKHCILNHQCTVDHDAVLEDYVHVAPGARVLGGARVGEGVLVGANAVVLPGQVVPPWSIVAAGTVWGYPRPKRRKKCVS